MLKLVKNSTEKIAHKFLDLMKENVETNKIANFTTDLIKETNARIEIYMSIYLSSMQTLKIKNIQFLNVMIVF